IYDMTPESYEFVRKRFVETRSGNKFIPPSVEGTLVFHIGGGAEWGGTAADPEGVFYVNSNEMPWDLRMMDLSTSIKEREKAMASRGEALYMTNCASCHGADLKGGGARFPALVNLSKRISRADAQQIIESGSGMMPSFRHLPEYRRNAILSYLLHTDEKVDLHNANEMTQAADSSNFPYVAPWVNNGQVQFRTPDGYPGVKPPWGTLNAVDLNTGEYLWKVPLGEFPELKAKGIPPTGTENHGGPIVTAGGLLFIGATQDELFRAFDKSTGEVL